MTMKVTFSPEIEPVVWFNWTSGVYLGAFWFPRVCVYTFLGESLLSGTFFSCIGTLYQSSCGRFCRSWDHEKFLPAVQKSLLPLIVQYSTEIVLSSSFSLHAPLWYKCIFYVGRFGQTSMLFQLLFINNLGYFSCAVVFSLCFYATLLLNEI